MIKMKKMKPLFVKTYDKGKVTIHNEITPGKEWALEEGAVATEKIDGSACMILDGKLYARYDFKSNKKNLPEGAIPCQLEADPLTGHFPHWVPVHDQPEYKWQREALGNSVILEDGSYEAVGPHFQSNPHEYEKDILIRHGWFVIGRSMFGEKMNFDSIREFLENNEVEGIVFYKSINSNDPEDMCKVTRRDFGIPWGNKVSKR